MNVILKRNEFSDDPRPPPPVSPRVLLRGAARVSGRIRDSFPASGVVFVLIFFAFAFFLLAGDARAQQPQIDCDSFTFPSSNPTDADVLTKLYCDTKGSSWTNTDNWGASDLDSWYGVIVDTEDPTKVTKLELNSNNLDGSIPSELGRLSELTVLGVHKNQLSGAIPSEFGSLGSLTWLNLSGNRGLTGELPVGLMELSGLETLNVECTGVSEPKDNPEFSKWFKGIRFISGCTLLPPPPPPPPPESDCEGLQEDREEGLAISPGCVDTSLVVISREDGKYTAIELSVPEGEGPPDDVPSIILPSSLIGRVETVTIDLSVPSEEELPEGLSLEGFVAEVGLDEYMLGEGETVTVCLPAPEDGGESASYLYRYQEEGSGSFSMSNIETVDDGEESVPGLYRYDRESGSWEPVSGSRMDTVNGVECVCGDTSSLPSLFGVFVEIPEPPVMEEEESGGGCSVVSDGAGGSGSRSAAFNLLLIISCLVVARIKTYGFCDPECQT